MRKICTILSLLVYQAAASQDSLKTTVLNEIVFSVNRTEEMLFSVPRSASVITSDQIDKSVYNSVGELLSQQEGIFITGSNQTPGSNQNIFMRGASSNHTAILIDGKKINDPSSPNAALDLSEISLTNIDRIEIIRGSHTSVYGGSAIGGIINIITKKNHRTGFHGNASLQAGTLGNKASVWNGQADLTYSLKNGLYVNASVWDQRSRGLDATVKTNDQVFSTYDHDDFSKRDMSLKTGFALSKVDAYLAYKRTSQHAEIDNGAFADDDNSFINFERNFYDYYTKYRLNESLSVLITGAFTDSERYAENDSSVVDEIGTTDRSFFSGSYKGALQTHEVQVNYSAGKFVSVFGGGLFNDKMKFDTYFFSNAFGFPFELVTDYDSINTSSTTTYLFGKTTYSQNDLSIDLGLRFSNHSVAGNALTFEVSPSYRLKNSLIFGSVSTGFNAPSLYQLYDPSIGFGSVTRRGNKNLKAEESASIELGVKHELNKRSSVTISLFRTMVENSIEYIYLWDGSISTPDLDYQHFRGDTYINASRQVVTGAEVAGALRLHEKLSLNANISVLKRTVSVDKKDIDPLLIDNNHIQLYDFGVFLSDEFKKEDLSRRPGMLANAQLTFAPVEKLTFTASYRYAGSRFDNAYDPSIGPFGALSGKEVDTYSLVDAGFSYRINRRFSLYSKFENILDEEYAEIRGYRTRGRSIYLKLLFNW